MAFDVGRTHFDRLCRGGVRGACTAAALADILRSEDEASCRNGLRQLEDHCSSTNLRACLFAAAGRMRIETEKWSKPCLQSAGPAVTNVKNVIAMCRRNRGPSSCVGLGAHTDELLSVDISGAPLARRLRRGCSRGDVLGCLALGFARRRKESSSGFDLLKRACALGEAHACDAALASIRLRCGDPTAGELKLVRRAATICAEAPGPGCRGVVRHWLFQQLSPLRRYRVHRARCRDAIADGCARQFEMLTRYGPMLGGERGVLRRAFDSCLATDGFRGCRGILRQLPTHGRRSFERTVDDILRNRCLEHGGEACSAYGRRRARPGLPSIAIDRVAEPLAPPQRSFGNASNESSSEPPGQDLRSLDCEEESTKCLNALLDAVRETRVRRGLDAEVAPSVVDLAERTCRAGNPAGCLMYGSMFEHGLGGTGDIEKAFELYRRVCKADYQIGACAQIGRLELKLGRREEGVDTLERYCEEHEYRDACVYLAAWELITDFDASDVVDAPRRSLQKHCDTERDDFACHYLGLARLEGLAGESPDRTAACEAFATACGDSEHHPSCFELRCLKGDLSACTRAGDYYASGRLGFLVDPARARARYSRACDGGHTSACERLESLER